MSSHLRAGFSPTAAGIIWLIVFCFESSSALAVSDRSLVRGEREPARISVLMATGMPGGTSYQVGLGLASLWTTKLRGAGIRVSGAISEGARENIEAIRIADADLILVEELFGSMAYSGTGVYKGRPLRELRSIATLWPETVHILIRSDRVRKGSLEDLVGLTLATGLPDSGNQFTTELLLKTLKKGNHKVRLRSIGYATSAELIKNGTVQALDGTGGIPVPIVSSLLQEGNPTLALIEISAARIKALREVGWKKVFRNVIPAGTYPGQNRPVPSVAQHNVLATAASLDPQVVYALTKTLYENVDYLARIHPACRSISLENALEGLSVPLHRGAVLYYTERNVKIPDHLLP